MKKINVLLLSLFVFVYGCEPPKETSSDTVQKQQSEKILMEATRETGMPAIKNFRERKILKDILEMRDQDGLVTYTYLFSEMTGKITFFCNSIGFGVPYATQYTNPQKIAEIGRGIHEYLYEVIPQADPNGLFSPASTEGTWILCRDPSGKNGTKPVYVEPKLIVSPFSLEKLTPEEK